MGADKDHIGMIFRNQWPGHRLGSVHWQVDANTYLPRLSSGIGLLYSHAGNIQGGFSETVYSLQLSYRVIMFDDHFLCLSGSLNYQKTEADINNFHYQFDTRSDYTILPEVIAGKTSLTGSFGILFQETTNKFYGGISLRDVNFTDLSYEADNYILKAPVLSVQGMGRIPLSRSKTLFLFGCFEQSGKISYSAATGPLQLKPVTASLFFQTNIFIDRKHTLGIGYKYFFGNYGSLNYRYGYMFGKHKKIGVGYSYDVKPYIQFDKLHFWSSHELYCKWTF